MWAHSFTPRLSATHCHCSIASFLFCLLSKTRRMQNWLNGLPSPKGTVWNLPCPDSHMSDVTEIDRNKKVIGCNAITRRTTIGEVEPGSVQSRLKCRIEPGSLFEDHIRMCCRHHLRAFAGTLWTTPVCLPAASISYTERRAKRVQPAIRPIITCDDLLCRLDNTIASLQRRVLESQGRSCRSDRTYMCWNRAQKPWSKFDPDFTVRCKVVGSTGS
jgi:hypothetical protein